MERNFGFSLVYYHEVKYLAYDTVNLDQNVYEWYKLTSEWYYFKDGVAR